MKKVLIILGLALLAWYVQSHAISVKPEVVGSAATDSIRITFCTTDTGYYPTPTDADSLELLVYPPDNGTADSVGEDAATLFNLSPGYYQYHRRGSNSAGDLGPYCLYVKAWYGGALRGNGTITWFVDPAGTYHYGVQDSARDFAHAVRESVTAHAPHGDNWASVGAGGADLSDEVDSILTVLYDRTNDSNFVRLIAHLLLHDSVTIDNSNAWDLSGGTDLSNEVDSLLTVLYDRTNDSNFVRLIAHLILHNPDDFKASGFSTHGAADVAALWGDTLTYLIAYRDSVNNAIADANKPNFHSSGDTIGREASTFDPAADTVAYVDSLIEDLTFTSVDSVRKVYIVDSLDQTISAQADTEAIARYNWNYPVRTLTSGAGTGSNQVTLRMKSSTDSSAIPGATIAVWNSDQTALIGLLDSDTDSGKQTFALNNGTYNLRINKYKFQWTVPITIGVSGNKDTTIYATEFTPSPPPAPYLVTVYGYIDSVGLVGHRAKISCTIHAQELRYGSVILGYYSYTKTAYTNASGYWEMFVYANEDLTPPGSMYEFTIKTPYQPVFTKWVTVPTPGPWELTW